MSVVLKGNEKPSLYKMPRIIMLMHRFNPIDNSVNRVDDSTVNNTSLGRDIYVRQVEPDRHPATVRCQRNVVPLRIATWNVRTLYQAGKLANILLE